MSAAPGQGAGRPFAERLDRQLAANYLELQLAEFRSQHFQRGNPSLYIGEAIFGIIALFLRDFAPLPQRIEAARARLHAIPQLLAQGTANVRAAPREWTQKALRECEGATRFLHEGLTLIAPDHAALHEAARVDGAGPWQVFRKITLPLLLVAVAPLLIASFAFNFNNFNNIFLLIGGGPPTGANSAAGGTDILISYTYNLAFKSATGHQYSTAAALSIFIFFIVATISGIAFWRSRTLETLT